MKNISLFIALAATSSLTVYAADPAPVAAAQATSTQATAKIATIDMQKALQSVDAGKKAKSQLEKEFNTKKKMLDDEQTAIKKLTEEFKKQSMVLNDEARMKKQSEIQERMGKFQEQMMRSQTEIQQKEGTLTAPIVQSLKDLVKEMAAKKGYQLVLDKNEAMVIFSQEKDDLTEEVVKTYNSKHKG
ncbi:MAG: OmpH family outer membrane protein [Cryobacterium sp.]|nr:OmpH family outer membrane protein [Oligoflexia bacterium]